MRKFLSLILALVFVSLGVSAQMSTYEFSSSQGTYAPITGGTVLWSGAILDQVVVADIGFTFKVNGVDQTQVKVYSNGFIASSNSAFTGTAGSPISSSSTADFTISVLGGFAQGEAVMGSEIRTETIGTAPNRTFVVQYKNMRRWGSSYPTTERLNYQIRLSESTNAIQFVYGDFSSAHTTVATRQVGLRGAANTDYHNRTTITDWAATARGTANSSSMRVSDLVYPATGLTYTFAQCQQGTITEVPTLTAPANNATGINATVNLTWNAVPSTTVCVDGYKVYAGTDNPPTNIANGTVVTGTSHTLSNLAAGAVVNWRVVAYNTTSEMTSATWKFTVAQFGSIAGTIKKPDGTPLEGANVNILPAVTGVTAQTTGADGKYNFGTNNIPVGSYTVTATQSAYTPTSKDVTVANGAVATADITMLQPQLAATPNPYNQVVNPNEVFNGAINLVNNGTGGAAWTVTVSNWSSGNTSWLTFGEASGTVNAGATRSIPMIFDATDMEAGATESVVVTITPTPNVGAIEIPVTMVVTGDELVAVESVSATITNQLTGATRVNWICNPGAGFQYYAIYRDGVQVHVAPTGNSWTGDVLPGYGSYEYCVSAVYEAGSSSPACAEELVWDVPELVYAPETLSDTLKPGENRPVGPVKLKLTNEGAGTLQFTFPDFLGGGQVNYCAASGGCDEYISGVKLETVTAPTTILNNTSACTNYGDYKHIVTSVVPGQQYKLTVSNGNAYSSDKMWVFFDWNQNGDFTDAGEFFEITGYNPGTLTFTVPAGTPNGKVVMRVRLGYNTAVAQMVPCGATSYGETEDYTLQIGVEDFISKVVPAEGLIQEGNTQTVDVWFSSMKAPYNAEGIYTSAVKFTTNDPMHASVTIPCQMTVLVPGTLAGVVTELGSNTPIDGVLVTAGGTSVTTNANGEFSMELTPDTLTVSYFKFGYAPATKDVIITAGDVANGDIQLGEEPYAPMCASASVDAADTRALVEWCVPGGPYILAYDDGVAENFTSWQDAGNMNAVKFSPKGNPAKVQIARFYVGNGEYPLGGNLIDQPFEVVIFAADGENGLPGTELGRVDATAENYGWVEVSNINIEVTGDFYVAMVQNTPAPNCVPLGIDETLPKAFKSYSINETNGGSWVLSPYQDFMIQVVLDGPMTSTGKGLAGTTLMVPGKVSGMLSQYETNTVPGYEGIAEVRSGGRGDEDAVTGYRIHRWSITDPTAALPGSGVQGTVFTAPATSTSINDGDAPWAALAAGWYGYGIEAKYPGDVYSDVVYTNYVPHKLNAKLTFNVQLICDNVPAEGAIVTLVGLEYPNKTYTGTVGADGKLIINPVIMGKYDISVAYPSYYVYNESVTITGDKTFNFVLEDRRSAPRNLFVDELTLHATWDEPIALLVQEDFEGTAFPPAGWTEEGTNPTKGWFRTNNIAGQYFNVPAHTYYAAVNDDANNDASNEWLITPAMDLTTMPSYTLTFASFVDLTYGGKATVELTTDNGATWTPIFTVPTGGWSNNEVDLSAFSGPTGYNNVQLAFHYDDAGEWANGFAVDDVTVASGGVEYKGFQFFLDNAIEGPMLPKDQFEYDINPSHVQWGHTYVAGVAAIYCSGYSDQSTYTFTSRFLFPPRNLEAFDYSDEFTLSALLKWEEPEGITPPTPTGQATIILEAHDVWGDGSGYQLLLDKDATAYGTIIPEQGPIHANCNPPATLYDEFEYTVPEGADPSCTSTNIVFDGTATIKVPSGTYDYCVVNPSPGDRLWIAGGANGRKNDYVIEAGKTYHFIAAIQGTGDAITINVSKQGERGQTIVEQVLVNTNGNFGEVREGFVVDNSQFAETAPSGKSNTVTPYTRAMWDIVLNIPVHSTEGEYGIASDGNFIYSNRWNSTAFYKYNMDGTFVEEFTISGAGNVRDMTYNPSTKRFYGSPNSTSIYEMDFENKTLVSTITSAVATRHIAYSPKLDNNNGGFYVGGWSDIAAIKMDGSSLGQTGTVNSCSGSAYDYANDILYVFEGGGDPPRIIRGLKPDYTSADISHDAADLGADGTSGGLEFYKKGKNTFLVGCLQNTKVFIYSLSGSGTVVTTEGVIAYRIYRDGSAVKDVPAEEGLETFDDQGLLPGNHCWDITAIYDLTEMGFPGETGESMFAVDYKPCLDIKSGKPLPFVEPWNNGFDLQGWTHGENWVIDAQLGNDAPSARFKWDPQLEGYGGDESSLTSPMLNASAQAPSTMYKIMLSFDVKLDDRNQTTKEKLDVEIGTSAGEEMSWTSVKQYVSNGDIDWENTVLDITSKVKDNSFQVRFNANGDKSSDIVYWAVDNVKVYFVYDAPINLVATRVGSSPAPFDVKVTWEDPAAPTPQPKWLKYTDDGGNGIGTGGAFDFNVSIMFDANDLADYAGYKVEKVKFFPNEQACQYSVRVWNGTSLVADQVVSSPVIGTWNEVTLTTPVAFDHTKNLYIGFRANAQAGYPAGCDEAGSPIKDGYSNLLSEDNGASWASLATINASLTYNWSIQGYIVPSKGGEVVALPMPAAPSNGNATLGVSYGDIVTLSENTDNTDATKVGYNLFRRAYYKDPEGANSGEVGEWVKLTETPITAKEYLDKNLSVEPENCYEYYATIVYNDGESGRSNIDYVCSKVSVKELDANGITMFPNPAIDYVTVQLSKEVKRVLVYNVLGSVVAEKDVKGQSEFTINTSNFAAGAYSVKFISEDGKTFSRKFVVTK